MEQETSNEMKTANNDKAGVSGSCFWGHRWTKWEQYNANILLLSDMKTEYKELRQKRYCLRCNKMEVEHVGNCR